MAEKETKLNIVIRTVDQATAKIKAINDRLDAATKPIRNFKDALGGLRESSGLDSVIGGFKGVGSAIGDVLGKVAMIGGVVAVAVGGLLHLVNEFDDLGKKSARLGVSVDFLAGMRDAAERAGVPVEALDDSLDTFAVNLGKARAGAGRMVKFLPKISTNLHADFGAVLLRNLTAAKGNAAAMAVLEDAMAKLTDPAERAALAMATLGDAKLAPMLMKGSKAIKEQIDHYEGLAGSEEGAAKSAGEVHESMLDLKAATDGMKAAVVEGLSPALKVLVDQLTEWFAGHREDVKQWAAEIGQKLPGAVHAVIDAIKRAIDTIAPFIDSIGGIKTVAIVLGAVLVGPLLLAITTLGVALLTTPFGLFLAGIAGIVAALTHLKEIKDWALGHLSEDLNKVADKAKKEGRDVRIDELFAGPKFGPDPAQDAVDSTKSATEAAIADLRKMTKVPQPVQVIPGMGELQRAEVTITVKNAQPGTRVTTSPNNTAAVDLNVGYATGWMP